MPSTDEAVFGARAARRNGLTFNTLQRFERHRLGADVTKPDLHVSFGVFATPPTFAFFAFFAPFAPLRALHASELCLSRFGVESFSHALR
jgi:hypothetical protein